MESQVLPIHFGNRQGKHEINADSLLVFLESYREIADFLGAEIEIQIGIPEEGGWKTNLFVVLGLVGINPIAALLTGETVDEWAKKGHVEIVQIINDFITREAKDIPENCPKEFIQQKNKIYQQFQKDDCIDSFRLGESEAIPKLNFPLYIQQVEDEEWIYLGETSITVSSPDWKGKRSWRGNVEILEDKENSFDFDKDLTGKFWEKVRLDSLPLHTTDVMRVQLVRRPTNKVKYLAIRVLSYNGEEIDAPLSEEIIRRKVTVVPQPIVGNGNGQQKLFDS